MVVVRECPRNKNLYYIRNPTSSKIVLVNVNRLLPAKNDNLDLGEPLGWLNPDRTGFEFDDALDGESIISTRPPGTVFEGDLIALRVEPDEHEKLPFSIGKVLRVSENKNLDVHWYGSTNNNMLSTWAPGFIQHNIDKRYYKNKPLHQPFPVYKRRDGNHTGLFRYYRNTIPARRRLPIARRNFACRSRAQKCRFSASV